MSGITHEGILKGLNFFADKSVVAAVAETVVEELHEDSLKKQGSV